jgi:hypothetical protein
MPHTVRVQAILAPMSDGSDAPWVSTEQIRQALRLATDVFRPADVEFLFDPVSDVVTIPRDLLSRDCTLAPNADFSGPKSAPPACDYPPPFPGYNSNDTERKRVAELYPGKLVAFFAFGRAPYWNETTQHWEDVRGGLAWSWSNHIFPFVRMNADAPGLSLSHEIGHYLHLVHTFGPTVSRLDDIVGEKGVRSLIREFIQNSRLPRNRGLEVFDGDLSICVANPMLHCITDTPPDPGDGLFRNEGLNPCAAGEGTLSFDVQWPDGEVISFAFVPDRENIMSYWNQTCRGLPARITRDQASGVQDAFVNQNRAHLTAMKVLYSAVWEAGDHRTTRAIGWAFSDFVPRFNNEIAAGHHVVHMQAYDLGSGQIRWDAVWEAGDHGTTRALGWAFSDFVPRFDAEIAAGHHLVHMQAYDLGGGQIRWDAVWEAGPVNPPRGTTRALGWTLTDFPVRFGFEIAAGHHLIHMQAYDLGGGQIRWDAVWEPGDHDTSFVLGWTLQDFSAQFARETAAGRHLMHLQAYDVGGGQIRYDGVWEAGDKGTSGVMGWGFNDFVWRLEQESGSGRRLVHQQAYDVGGGRIRYDGIWENNVGGGPQTRILSESIYRFADRFDKEIAAGRHVTHMQAVLGR